MTLEPGEPEYPPWPSGLWFIQLIALVALVGGVLVALVDKTLMMPTILFLVAIGLVMLVRWSKAHWERQSGIAWRDRPR